MFLPLRSIPQYCGCGLTAFAIELWPRSLIKWFWRVGALWPPKLKLSGRAVRLHSWKRLVVVGEVEVIKSVRSATVEVVK